MFDLFYIICKSPICSAAYAELMGLRAERKYFQNESSSFKRPLPLEERVLYECSKEFREGKNKQLFHNSFLNAGNNFRKNIRHLQ